jgi:AcrR family transcriptional regulator
MAMREVATHDAGGRRALIDATVAAIEEDGLAGVSLRAITRRAEVSHAAPAHHFRDKAGLFTAVALEGFAELHRQLSEAAREPHVLRRLQALGLAYVTFAVNNRAHFEVMFRPELLTPNDPGLEVAGTATFAILREAMQGAQDEGHGLQWDVDDLTLACWALAHGIVELTATGVMDKAGYSGGAPRLADRLLNMVGELLWNASPSPQRDHPVTQP